jgi:repressor of nif and glnA expression
MTIWDDRILEYIEEEGSASPGELENSGFFRISRSQISRRLRKLNEKGMLDHLGNGVYVITDLGQKYLNEEIDAEEVDDLNGGKDGAQA